MIVRRKGVVGSLCTVVPCFEKITDDFQKIIVFINNYLLDYLLVSHQILIEEHHIIIFNLIRCNRLTMNTPQDPPSLSTSSSSLSNKRSREDLDDHYESSLLHSNDKSHIIAIDNSGDGSQIYNVRHKHTVTRNKRLHRGKYDKFQVVNDSNHSNTVSFEKYILYL